MKIAPCKDCLDRRFNCHALCSVYKEWKQELDDTKAWLRSQEPIMPVKLEQAIRKKMLRHARGHDRHHGGGEFNG